MYFPCVCNDSWDPSEQNTFFCVFVDMWGPREQHTVVHVFLIVGVTSSKKHIIFFMRFKYLGSPGAKLLYFPYAVLTYLGSPGAKQLYFPYVFFYSWCPQEQNSSIFHMFLNSWRPSEQKHFIFLMFSLHVASCC